jgi:hypothetical protein
VLKAAAPLGAELYLGLRRHTPVIHNVDPSLKPVAERLCHMAREHSHNFKLASKKYGEQIITRQSVQARLSDSAMWLHAWACALSKLDQDLRNGPHSNGEASRFERDRAAATYFMDMAEREIGHCFRGLFENDDDAMVAAAKAALAFSATLPNDPFAIPEKSPVAAGTGRQADQSAIQQFPGKASGNSNA